MFDDKSTNLTNEKALWVQVMGWLAQSGNKPVPEPDLGHHMASLGYNEYKIND